VPHPDEFNATSAACFRHVLDLDPEHPKTRLLRAFLEARS
jgi:hypothetical protein